MAFWVALFHSEEEQKTEKYQNVEILTAANATQIF
jgi:hypothetical protein